MSLDIGDHVFQYHLKWAPNLCLSISEKDSVGRDGKMGTEKTLNLCQNERQNKQIFKIATWIKSLLYNMGTHHESENSARDKD